MADVPDDSDPNWQISEDGLTYTRTIRMYFEPSEYQIGQFYRYYIATIGSEQLWDEADQKIVYGE